VRCRSCEQADVKLFGYSALSYMYLIHCAQSSPGSPPFNQSLSSARIVGFQLSCSGTITCMEVAAKPACGWQRPVELNGKPRLPSTVSTWLFLRFPLLCATAIYKLSHLRTGICCARRCGEIARLRWPEVDIALSHISRVRCISEVHRYFVVLLFMRRALLQLLRSYCVVYVECMLCFCSTRNCQKVVIGGQRRRLCSRL